MIIIIIKLYFRESTVNKLMLQSLEREEEFEEMSQEKKNVLRMFILSVPWCCNIGGAGSLYGSPANLVLKATIERYVCFIYLEFVRFSPVSFSCISFARQLCCE